MFGDLGNCNPETLDELARILQRPAVYAQNQDCGHQELNVNQLPTTNSISSNNSSNVNPSQISHRNVQNSTSSSCNQTLQQCPMNKYFELCVNMGEYNVSLVEIEIATPQSKITTDGQLFKKIKENYNKQRGFLKTNVFRLFKPARVDFVQVNTVHQNL